MSKLPAVEFEHITFGYRDNATNLNDVSFKIQENEYVCIIGHNGSGKSTLSKVLTGLLKARSGNIKLFGQTITKLNLKYLRDNIGIVFQNPDNQFVGLTVEDDMAFGLENRKVDPLRMKEIIHSVAEAIGITDLLKYEPAKLSGGQKQRVAIASVLAINPQIIIFDESTSMLDPKAKKELKNLMLVLKNRFNKTIISITHDMEEVVNADRVIVMHQARIAKIGSPQEIFADRNFLNKISLDVPFSLQLINSLANEGVAVNHHLQIDKIVDEIGKIR
jgi:energy-coupling factor transport system ATP-binding protein